MPWYVYIALRHLFPKGRAFPLFTCISVVGPALGVCLLVTVISVFNGFGNEIRTRIAEIHGDLIVEKRGLFDNYEETLEELEAKEYVEHVAPFAHGYVMLQHGNKPVFPVIQGVDPLLEQEVVPIDQYIVAGSVEDFDDDSVLLSSGLARSVQAEVGSTLEIFTPLMMEGLKKDEVLLPREVVVAAIYSTGWGDTDANTVLCTLRTMQDLYGLGDSAHGLKVSLVDGYNVDRVVRDLNRELSINLRAYSSLSTFKAFLAAVEMEKKMMYFFLFLIVIVGALAILSSLLVSVLRKRREIGLYSSMGASPKETGICFCIQGFIVGVMGVAAGFYIAFGLLAIRNPVMNLLTKIFGMGDVMGDVYGFNELPIQVKMFDNVLTAVLTIIVSTLAGLIPAWWASRQKPAEALRSE